MTRFPFVQTVVLVHDIIFFFFFLQSPCMGAGGGFSLSMCHLAVSERSQRLGNPTCAPGARLQRPQRTLQPPKPCESRRPSRKAEPLHWLWEAFRSVAAGPGSLHCDVGAPICTPGLSLAIPLPYSLNTPTAPNMRGYKRYDLRPHSKAHRCQMPLPCPHLPSPSKGLTCKSGV